MSVYVNADDILECVVSARQNPQFNDSPQKDSALLTVQEFIQQAIWHPLMTDSFTVGSCEGCVYKGTRHQKSTCCRENPNLKSRYRSEL